ncbi:Rv1733c family protein [Streptomyces thermoalcalitolerans]|uniref:Integral membrane protein n=1 Tax=Streptomyces thermoalcalitolerans TaxID=65605 RepID=A0ABP3ZC31_9ACTN
MAFRVPRAWLWRWRRSPLRRRVDTVEAWVLLGTWVLTVLTGVLAGWTAAREVERGLAQERLQRRPTTALVTERAPGLPAGSSQVRVWGKVRWTAGDGTERTGHARVRPGSAAGTPVTVWTDYRGRLVAEPATPAVARARAGATGTLVGAGAAAVPLAAGRVLRTRLERRRMARWDAEWARFGPLWSRTIR